MNKFHAYKDGNLVATEGHSEISVRRPGENADLNDNDLSDPGDLLELIGDIDTS